jgi:lipopolysaccharide transport system ATP-binding protein
MKDKEIAIHVEGLGKRYRRFQHQESSLKGALDDKLKRLLRRGDQSSRRRVDFWALRDISFEVRRGEALGLIGPNGAGKSTLLKILSRVTPPTEGRALLLGRLASLLEVGLGFHHELSGRENVFLNGALMGMTQREIAAKFDAIVDFSGISDFIDTPIKHYSTGMTARLGFAVLAHVDADILLIDEVLAVGDAQFQRKCFNHIGQRIQEGKTIIFVSHHLDSIKHLCRRCVLLEQGRVAYRGETAKVVEHYLNHVDSGGARGNAAYRGQRNAPAYFSYLHTEEDKTEFTYEEEIVLRGVIALNQDVLNLRIAMSLVDQYGHKVFTSAFQFPPQLSRKREQLPFSVVIPAGLIAPNPYAFSWELGQVGKVPYDNVARVCPIKVVDPHPNPNPAEDYGRVFVNCRWMATDEGPANNQAL